MLYNRSFIFAAGLIGRFILLIHGIVGLYIVKSLPGLLYTLVEKNNYQYHDDQYNYAGYHCNVYLGPKYINLCQPHLLITIVTEIVADTCIGNCFDYIS